MKWIVGIILSTALLVGCAHVAVKQHAVVGLQSVHLALSAAQDYERDAYARQSIPGWTEERHKGFALFLAKAFDDEIKAATALKAYRAGEPLPTSLADLQKDSEDALAVVQELVPGSAVLVAKVQSVVSAVLNVIAVARA